MPGSETATPPVTGPGSETLTPPVTGPGTLAGTAWTRVDLVIGVLVGVLVAVVGLVWRTEVVPTDPWHYVQAALNFPQDSWVPLGYTRYGMVLPVGPLAILFRDSQVTYYFWPLVGSAMLAGSVYLLGRRWWGHVAGLLAVVLLVTNSIVFVNLSRYYPDVISTGLVFVALALAVAVRGRELTGGRHTVPLLLLTGLFLGWSFEARETAIFIWPAIIVVLWVRGSLRRNILWVALPVLGWAAIDVGIGAVAYGDPLLKLHTFTHQNLATTDNPADQAVLKEFVGRPRLDYLRMIPDLLLAKGAPIGAAWMLAFGAVAALTVLVKNAAARLVSFSFITSYLLFVGISGMLLPSRPAGRLDIERYWIQFFPAVSLCIAGVLVVTVAWLGRLVGAGPALRTTMAALVGVLVAVGPTSALVPYVRDSPTFAPSGATALQEVRGYLAGHQSADATVWSDWETNRLLLLYRRGPFGGPERWTMRSGSLTGSVAPRAGDYVLLVNTAYPACAFCANATKKWRAEHPTLPATWVPVFTTSTDTATIYRVS